MNADNALSKTVEAFVRAYESNRGAALNGTNATVRDRRDAAIERFSELGLPSRKDEAWKYTNISRVLADEYTVHVEPTDTGITRADVAAQMLPGLDAHLVVLVNGHFRADLSDIGELPEGVVVAGFEEAAKHHSSVIDAHFGHYADAEQEAFIALNTAFVRDGVFVYVPKSTILETPVHVMHITSTDEHLMLQPRNLFVVEENAQARIVETQACLTDTKTFTNSVTEAYVDRYGRLDHFLLQDEGSAASQVNTLEAFQEENSYFSTDTVTLSGDVVRNNLHIMHDGEHVESRLYGLFLGRDEMHVDNNTLVDHAKPNCLSDELYKGVLRDDAVGVFNGKVFVHRDAQKTNAYQQNQSILLDETAQMYSKPELEIYADDVQCSHGATTGQLDEEGVFYLRSRGLSNERARALMLVAFARDVIDGISLDPLRAYVDEKVTQRFQEAARV